MHIDELRALITLAGQQPLALLELKRDGFRLRLEGAVPAASRPMSHAEPASAAAAVIAAPGFGFFCTRHPARAAPLCDDSGMTRAGDVLALIRVDDLYLPVVSDRAGVVRRLVEDGVLVGYGTPLFEIAA